MAVAFGAGGGLRSPVEELLGGSWIFNYRANVGLDNGLTLAASASPIGGFVKAVSPKQKAAKLLRSAGGKMSVQNLFEVVSNDDGTITFQGTKLAGEAVAALAVDLLAAMVRSATNSGRHQEAIKIGKDETIHGIRPSLIGAMQSPRGQDQRLMLACGFAHIAVVVPTHIVRALGESLLALSAPDEGQAN